jgi:putative glycosyltransferase (TIGR04348 family)
MPHSSVVIVSPALADANNGNWQTALRWRQLLRGTHHVRITQQWPDDRAAGDQFMLALHARRSAGAIRAWAEARGPDGLAVVLTGTDLYGDLAIDPEAAHSIECAQRLVVLQELGPLALPQKVRFKTRVIYQSTLPRSPLAKTARSLHAVMVGHLRAVKSPQTLFDAAQLLAKRKDIRISHIGDASEAALGDLARQTQRECPNYRWLGGLPHPATLRAIARAHVLVHTSAMEGGAHVIMEAVRSGTPVLASRVDGNIGMLGHDYGGYFEHGNAAELVAMLERCRADQQEGSASSPDSLLGRLRAQCDLRAPLFAPEAERAGLLQLICELQGRPVTAE